MARLFSWKPALTYRGRQFKGLRGWAGKPLHPPLTDIPVASYFLVGCFDIISFFGPESAAGDFFQAGTFVIIAGAIVSLPTTLTGFWDWLKSTAPHTQAWRTANSHMAIMVIVTLLVLINIVMRLNTSDSTSAPGLITILSVLVALLVGVGAAYGGSLAFDYGFNVETAGDSPVWHESEEDVYPGSR